ncbi:response regulator transcription factor [Polyangium mundeleinium]|uniref:Response regulator transcription factor n=1 Tax=Polyangium mundeleinium TaxID=2995306 RepID=A0ABT5EL29_9BACT|nr:response regulator transcription factor [Polyangium mundeleinium]MDC0741431.1 response regulator transcription factor [Polyangium mundeleinium]
MSDPKAKPRLLVVEDDMQVLQGLVSGLARAGFDVTVAMDGDAATRLALQPFDALVLDLMLPGRTGFDVLAAVSGRVSTPVIVLSARTELTSRMKSFELGAVDFVPKPFWIEELVVRLRTRLALREKAPPRTLAVGSVFLDLDRRTATRDGDDMGLTRFEFNILAWLVERPGRAVSRRALAESTLTEDAGVTERTVDTHVSRIRKKLGHDGKRVTTVWGIGYRYTPVEEP